MMAKPGVMSTIASATSVKQLHELLGAVELSLREDDIQALIRASVTE
jgi:aryl-alcohol dehydrogenase-like predicted oxidoreductase